MATERHEISVRGLAVEIVRKDIKNLHLGVYPPDGRVRVAAPLTVSDEAVRLAVIARLGWVQRQRTRFAEQARQSKRQLLTGETHYYLGRPYRLRVVEGAGRPRVELSRANLVLFTRPASSSEERERLLLGWYRTELKTLIPPLLAKWEPVLGVKAAVWGIRRMKTKWGSCNTETVRIWLNLELAKKPARCLEYLLVHELVHLRERRHNERFLCLMDQYLPDWRHRRAELNAAPLGHEEWSY